MIKKLSLIVVAIFAVSFISIPPVSAGNDTNVNIGVVSENDDITAKIKLQTETGSITCYVSGVNILDTLEDLDDRIGDVNKSIETVNSHVNYNNYYIRRVDNQLIATNEKLDNYIKYRNRWGESVENYVENNRNMIMLNDNEIKKNYNRIVDIHNSMKSFVENTYNEFVVWTEDSVRVLGERTDRNHQDTVELRYWRDSFAENYQGFKNRYWEFKKEQAKLWEESYDFRGRTHARFDRQRDNLIAIEYQHEDLERMFRLSEDEEESHEARQREEFDGINEDITQLNQRTIFIILAVVCLVAIILIQMAYSRQERERQEKRIESLEKIIVNEQENE